MSPNPTLLTGLGAAFSLFLSGAGAAFATSHASMFAIRHPTTMAMIPVIEAGLLALYGFIIGYLLTRKINAKDDMALADGYKCMCAGLSLGLACLASGVGMGMNLKKLNDEGYFFVQKGKAAPDGGSKKGSFFQFILCFVFFDAIGLYGLIVALCLL